MINAYLKKHVYYLFGIVLFSLLINLGSAWDDILLRMKKPLFQQIFLATVVLLYGYLYFILKVYSKLFFKCSWYKALDQRLQAVFFVLLSVGAVLLGHMSILNFLLAQRKKGTLFQWDYFQTDFWFFFIPLVLYVIFLYLKPEVFLFNIPKRKKIALIDQEKYRFDENQRAKVLPVEMVTDVDAVFTNQPTEVLPLAIEGKSPFEESQRVEELPAEIVTDVDAVFTNQLTKVLPLETAAEVERIHERQLVENLGTDDPLEKETYASVSSLMETETPDENRQLLILWEDSRVVRVLFEYYKKEFLYKEQWDLSGDIALWKLFLLEKREKLVFGYFLNGEKWILQDFDDIVLKNPWLLKINQYFYINMLYVLEDPQVRKIVNGNKKDGAKLKESNSELVTLYTEISTVMEAVIDVDKLELSLQLSRRMKQKYFNVFWEESNLQKLDHSRLQDTVGRIAT